MENYSLDFQFYYNIFFSFQSQSVKLFKKIHCFSQFFICFCYFFFPFREKKSLWNIQFFLDYIFSLIALVSSFDPNLVSYELGGLEIFIEKTLLTNSSKACTYDERPSILSVIFSLNSSRSIRLVVLTKGSWVEFEFQRKFEENTLRFGLRGEKDIFLFWNLILRNSLFAVWNYELLILIKFKFFNFAKNLSLFLNWNYLFFIRWLRWEISYNIKYKYNKS